MKVFLLLFMSVLLSPFAKTQSVILKDNERLSAPKNFSVNGKATAGMDYSTNSYYGQNNNRTRYYFLAQPQIKIGDFPFTTTFMLTSENGAYSQNMSSFGIRFDAKEYSESLRQKSLNAIQNNPSHQQAIKRAREAEQKVNNINFQEEQLKKEQENISVRSVQLQTWKDSGYALSYEQMHEAQTIQQKQTEITQQLATLQNQKESLASIGNKLNGYGNYTNPSHEQIESELKKNGKLNGTEKFFLNTEKMGIGMITLNYSELMLNGAVVEGGEFTYSPKNFSAGFAGGKTKFISNQFFPSFNNTNTISAFNYRPFLKDAYFTTAHFGFGRTDGAHLHFRYVHVLDNASSASQQQKPTAVNDMVGADFLFPVFKYIKIGGEFARSLYSPDKYAAPLPANLQDNEPMSSIHKPNITTKKGNGYLLKTQFEKNGIIISMRTRYMEPRYHTLGVYFMNSSRLFTEEKISYKLKTLPVAASISHSFMEADLNDGKSVFQKYNSSITWSPQNLPVWNIVYTKYSYHTFTGSNRYASNGKIVAVTTSHKYHVKKIACASLVSITGQKTLNSAAASDTKPNSTNIYSVSVQQNVVLNKGVVVSAGATSNKTVAAGNEFYQSFGNASVLIPVAKKHHLEIFSRANFMEQIIYRMSAGANIEVRCSKNVFFKIRGEYMHWLNGGVVNATGSFTGSAAVTVMW